MNQSQALRKDFEFYAESTCYFAFLLRRKVYVMTDFFGKQEVANDTLQCDLKFSDLFQH